MREEGALMDHLSKIVVTDIKETLTVSSPKGRFEKINNRKSYGISFCISGQITYTHRGEKFVSDPEHAVILAAGAKLHAFWRQTG